MLHSVKSIAQFRVTTPMILLAASILYGFCAVSPLMHAQVPTNDHHKWNVYTNVRFHYSVCYPQDLLSPLGEAENSDGQTFLAKDGAKLVVFGQNNSLNEPLEDRLTDSASRLTGTSGKVTYRVIKPAWFVVSGQTGQSVFYAKTLYAGEQFKSFELTYGISESSVYKPIIGRLAGCFVNTKP
jgi:hypothetical protein